ncbi:hypothetical protein J3Q64DRAFT_1730066 [Phycomyces blakesleeanus]|uniref:Uncharacterized protein n=1 Tax=Phycomyces blakesleeanus TaxID=4837 RepID=A0ABR3B973_PHYBL
MYIFVCVCTCGSITIYFAKISELVPHLNIISLFLDLGYLFNFSVLPLISILIFKLEFV